MKMRRNITIILIVTIVALAPPFAWAEGFASFLFGGAFCPNEDACEFAFSGNSPHNQFGFGLGVGGMFRKKIGAEFEFSFLGNKIKTIMGNLIVGAPLGRIRPYASAGVGSLTSDLETIFGDTLPETDFGFNVGGGIMGFLNDRFGLRAEARYFKILSNPPPEFNIEKLAYLRVSGGIIIRFW